MGAEKKTKKERAATRKAQNERYRATKEAAGLRQVSVWVPAEALDKVSDLSKVGIVVAEAGVPACVVKMGRKGRKVSFEVVERQGQLLEKENPTCK